MGVGRVVGGDAVMDTIVFIDSHGKRYPYREIEAMLVDDELPVWCDTSRWTL